MGIFGEDLAAVKALGDELRLENDIAWFDQVPIQEAFRHLPVLAAMRAAVYGQFCGTCRRHSRRRGSAGDRHQVRRNP